jgi:tetratricopeptide (TPR) repeat protein
VSEPGTSSEHHPPQLPPDERLDSWKEIAAFLHRDVRTVQRWEKHAGLPIHRHTEARLRTAYAYRSELEAWWRTQRQALESASLPEEPTAPNISQPIELSLRTARRLRLRTGAFIGVVGALALAGVMAVISRGARPVANPSRIDHPVAVVLANFEGQAGDPRLLAVLDQAVARYLTEHQELEPATPAHTARLLRLMRREPGTPLSEGLGRELVARDGRLRYVISGRVHTLETRHFAEIRVVDAEGRSRAALEWEAATTDRLVSQSRKTVGQLARLVIDAAAHDAPPPGQLEQVTSASTAAVKLYTAAIQAGLRGQWGASEQLARRAIALDSDFASAHAWVGWTMRRQGRANRECLPFFERAQALSRGLTDRETYLISAWSNSVAGALRPAISSLEAILRLDPSDRQALDMLIEASWRMGRVKRAVDLSVIRAERYPDDFYANVRAARALAAVQGNTSRAAIFADRAGSLASSDTLGDRASWHAWLLVFPVFQRWIDGDGRGAVDALNALDRSLPGRLGRERDAFAAAIGFAHLAFGRTQQADHAFRYGSAPERQMNLAVLALTQGDEAGARRWLAQVREHSARRPALFARVGFEDEAERGLDTIPPSDHLEGIVAVTRGLLALRRHQVEPAAASLRGGLDLLRSSGEPAYFFASEALAAIADARGDVARSIRLLSDAADERPHTYGVSQWSAAYWIGANHDLIRRCRRAGRHDEAERISAELRKMLDVNTGGVRDATYPAPR